MSKINCYFLQKDSMLKHQGVILIVALVILLIMTIIGVTLTSGAALQERIARNYRQKIIVRMNAEQALRQAEFFLDNLDIIDENQLQVLFMKTNGLYASLPLGGGGHKQKIMFDRSKNEMWKDDNSIPVNIKGRYIIEYVGTYDTYGFGKANDGKPRSGADFKRKIFRITSIGFSDNNSVVSIFGSSYLEAWQ